jgi:hypothetical protein
MGAASVPYHNHTQLLLKNFGLEIFFVLSMPMQSLTRQETILLIFVFETKNLSSHLHGLH